MFFLMLPASDGSRQGYFLDLFPGSGWLPAILDLPWLEAAPLQS